MDSHVTEAKTTADNPSVLERLLRMADAYWAAGAFHNAIELYFQLIHDLPESLEAGQARERLLEIGEKYEINGERRQARSIYQQLL